MWILKPPSFPPHDLPAFAAVICRCTRAARLWRPVKSLGTEYGHRRRSRPGSGEHPPRRSSSLPFTITLRIFGQSKRMSKGGLVSWIEDPQPAHRARSQQRTGRDAQVAARTLPRNSTRNPSAGRDFQARQRIFEPRRARADRRTDGSGKRDPHAPRCNGAPRRPQLAPEKKSRETNDRKAAGRQKDGSHEALHVSTPLGRKH